MRGFLGPLAGTWALIVLAGCGQEADRPEEFPPRAIKHMTVGQVAGKDNRILAGVVEAGTSSNVAFEIKGRIVEISAKVGDAVQTGQRLAQLDPKPYELELRQAELALEQANASLVDAQQKYAQTKELWDKRFATRTAFDTATATLRNAQAQVGIANSQLELRKRDVEKTNLVAPFSGTVSERKVEVFEEITPGQAIYVVQTQGENKVQIAAPDSLIGSIRIGQDVTVRFPTLKGRNEVAAGKVTEISPQAGDASAFPVVVRLTTSPTGVRSGMSAEVQFRFATAATGTAFSVPIGALKPSIKGNNALVYVFDKETGVVRERSVRVVGVDGNEPQIVGELKAGDVIATAGVGHMYDGMKVRLMPAEKPF